MKCCCHWKIMLSLKNHVVIRHLNVVIKKVVILEGGSLLSSSPAIVSRWFLLTMLWTMIFRLIKLSRSVLSSGSWWMPGERSYTDKCIVCAPWGSGGMTNLNVSYSDRPPSRTQHTHGAASRCRLVEPVLDGSCRRRVPKRRCTSWTACLSCSASPITLASFKLKETHI